MVKVQTALIDPVDKLASAVVRRRCRRLLRLQVGIATTAALLSVVSHFAYLGPVGAFFGGFVVAALGLGFPAMLLLGHVPSARLRIVAIGPRFRLTARDFGSDLTHFGNAASKRVKRWAAAVVAATLISLVAGGPSPLPEGIPEVQGGSYIAYSHGIVHRLTREQYEDLSMRLLRFAALCSAGMIALFATLISGALESEDWRS
jgi:hypothetical protein